MNPSIDAEIAALDRKPRFNNALEKTVSNIVDAASMVAGVARMRILSRARDSEVLEARRLVVFVARQRGYSFEKIGACIGRHHAAVLHMVRMASGLYETDPLFKQRADQVGGLAV